MTCVLPKTLDWATITETVSLVEEVQGAEGGSVGEGVLQLYFTEKEWSFILVISTASQLTTDHMQVALWVYMCVYVHECVCVCACWVCMFVYVCMCMCVQCGIWSGDLRKVVVAQLVAAIVLKKHCIAGTHRNEMREIHADKWGQGTNAGDAMRLGALIQVTQWGQRLFGLLFYYKIYLWL